MRHDKERLRWQCRRGMLELDLLLERFLDSQFEHLLPQAQIDFIHLLQQPDTLLISWMVGSATPDDKGFAQLIAAMRAIPNEKP